jgi:phospholipid/cholesterol/gamma-HCH transport system substrate-binding protein
METRSPSVAKVITMVLFALSCVGLLLFLWLSFGGTMPFNPQGYRVKVSFQYAGELAPQSQVRIAGVNVGTVVDTKLAPNGNRTLATLQIDKQYAPLPANTRAILRTKTILGETYVQLSQGQRNGHFIADGGQIPNSQVVPAVQLDQIFSAFDPKTRRAFQQWQLELAGVIKGNDQNLNSVIGNLPSFAGNFSQILNILDIQHQAVVGLVQNGGTVFDAISRDPAALQSLIRTGETTFHSLAIENRALADTFHVFPTFLSESKLTMTRLQSFAENTNPLLIQLQPVAHELGPTLRAVRELSPSLRHFFVSLGPLITVSRTGLPATAEVLRGARPVLGALGPFLGELNPILNWLAIHPQLLSDFLSDGAAGLAAKTLAFGGNGSGHYLRQFGPTGAETLAIQPTRDANNRGDTYPPPLWLTGPAPFDYGNFDAWDCKNTGGPHGATTSSVPGQSQEACWVAPTLPGASPGRIPYIMAQHYSAAPRRSEPGVPGTIPYSKVN